MDIRHRTEILAGYYSGLNDFRWSEKYSRSDQFVHIAADQSGWLVVDWKTKDRVQVRLTDGDGRVKAWDDYLADGTDIQLLSAIRRSEHEREHVTFTPEEIKMLHQFKYGGRKGTISMLTDILPVIKDRQTRGIVESTAEKIGRLAENDFKNLAEATKKRFEIEMERKIRARGNEVRQQGRKR